MQTVNSSIDRAQEPVYDLVTISREYGSGGRDFAAALGQRLGWLVLDQDLTHRVAKRMKLDDEAIEQMDERPPTLMARIASALLVPMPDSPLIPDPTALFDPDTVAAAVRDEILEAVQTLPLIVVGHGAQSLFHDRPSTLHIRLVAPIEVRVQRLVARYDWDEDRARTQAQQLDKERANYIRRYYHTDIADPLLYDLQINTAQLSLANAVNMVVTLIAKN